MNSKEDHVEYIAKRMHRGSHDVQEEDGPIPDFTHIFIFLWNNVVLECNPALQCILDTMHRYT